MRYQIKVRHTGNAIIPLKAASYLITVQYDIKNSCVLLLVLVSNRLFLVYQIRIYKNLLFFKIKPIIIETLLLTIIYHKAISDPSPEFIFEFYDRDAFFIF